MEVDGLSSETQALLLQLGAPELGQRRGKLSCDRRNAGYTRNVPTGHV